MTLEFVKGDTEKLAVPVKNEDIDEFVSDLSGVSVLYQLTMQRGGGDVLIEKTDADAAVSIVAASTIDDDELTNAGVGSTDDVILIEINETDMTDVPPGLYWHELEVDFGGLPKTVITPTNVRITRSNT